MPNVFSGDRAADGYRADVVGGAEAVPDGRIETGRIEGEDDGEGIKVVREVTLHSDDGDEEDVDVDRGFRDGEEDKMDDAVEEELERELEWGERLERKRRRREEEAGRS